MQSTLPSAAPSVPAWRIRQGSVDLFLARLESGRSPGARRHLGRAGPGSVVLSPKPAHGYCLILEPSVPADLEDISPEALTSGDLHSWIACLGGGSDPVADWEQFHDSALARLAGIANDDESRATERIRARARLDRESLAEAQRALSGILDSGDTEASFPAAGDPLLRAASAVCRAAGITTELKGVPRESVLLDPMELLARVNRLRVRRVSLAGDWWTRDAGPLTGYFAESRQPVALLPRSGHYICWNPTTESAQRVTRAVAGTLAGTAFSFYRRFPPGRVTPWSLLTFAARGVKRDGSIVLFTGALASAAAMVTPIATGLVFDSIVPSADRRQLVRVFIILVAAAAATAFLNLARNLALLRIETRVDASVQAALQDRLLSLPATFFRGYTAGDLAQRSLAVSHIREMLAGAAIPSLLAGVFSLSSFALMFSYGGSELAISASAIMMAPFAVTVAAGIAQVRLQRRLAAAEGQVSGLLPQLLAGVTKIRTAAAEQRAFARWAAAFARQKSIAAGARRVRIGLNIFFPAFQAVAMIFLLQMLSHRDGISAGSYFAFQSAFLQVLLGASRAGSALVTILAVVPHYERAKPVLDALPEAVSGASDPGELKGGVELAHVSFRYRPELPLVLQDLSLRATPGEFVAIVGASGSGKSTVLRLLLGFEKPEAGSLFFDGRDLAGLDIDLVRRQAGAVLQQGRVLAGTVYANIAGAAPLSMDAAWEAARLAGLDQDLRNMPMGMHTLVAEGGIGLSGGQIQRLQIARALARRPRIILFDEATSALDNRTQAVVMESLARLDVTRIVVAHRLSTIRGADRIYVMDRGSAVESGSYDELMERGGLFTELARRQAT